MSAAEMRLLPRQRVALGHDAEQPALGQRLEGHHGMLEARAHRHRFALAQQDVVERLLELQDVHVDQEVGEALAHALDSARHHDVGDAGHRADPELGVGALRQAADDVLQVADLVVDGVDLAEDVARLGARGVAAMAAAEQFQAEDGLGMLHHPADARRGDVEQARRAAHGSGHHDGPDDLDLAQRQHAGRA